MSSIVDLKILKVIGVFIVFYWLSLFVYLPPITPYPDLDSYVDKVQKTKETLGPAYPAKIDMPREDLKRELVKETNLMYAAYIFPMAFGLFSGVLIYRKKRLGQIIAICLSVGFIVIQFKVIFSTYPNFLNIFQVMLKFSPMKTLHEMVFGSLFFVVTLALLASPPISRLFKTKRPLNQSIKADEK